MKKAAFMVILMLILPLGGKLALATYEALLFDGYMDKGESILVGPLVITLVDTTVNYTTGDEYALFIITKDGQLIGGKYVTIYVPDPEKMARLLANPEFLVALAETQGYDVEECAGYVNDTAEFNACLLANAYGFYQWLNHASPEEIAKAVMQTIDEHPELGITKEDVTKPITYPESMPIKEGDTVEFMVDNRTVTLSVPEVYPNVARVIVNGPSQWKGATAPGNIVSTVRITEYVYPGDTATVEVTLKNEGATKARYVNVFVSPEPIAFNNTPSLASGLSAVLSQGKFSQEVFYPKWSSVQYVEYIEPKGSTTLTFKIRVNPNADIGIYPVYVGIIYFTGVGENMRMVQSYNVVALRIYQKRSAFVEITRVETEPMEISPGDTFTVRFTLENPGAEPVKALSLKISSYKVPVQGEIKNVDLSALSQLPLQGSEQLSGSLQDALNQIMAQLAKQNIEAFLPIGEDNVKYVAELQPGDKTTLEFRIKANDRLENGIYPLRIELKYLTEPSEEEITDERLVGIDVTGRAQLILSKVSTSPGKIIPGTDNIEVDFQVDNVGTGTARTVIVKPMPEWPFSLSESSEQMLGLGSLGKGDSAQSSFKINVANNASSGTYEIPLLVTYTNDLGITKNVTLKVPVIIGAKPNIEVVGVRFDPEPLQGEAVNVYIKLKNTGGEKATSVLIEGVVKADQPFSLDKRTDYIGDLAPGAVGEGVIVLKIDKNAIPKDYSIGLRIRAVGDPNQGDDNVYVFERTVVMTVGENTKTESNLRNLAIAIGALVVVVVLYTYMRGRKK
ncbi:COG1361 S-layer family protein [Thermococcus aciditolerans]|uniref:S-layer protein n=1 Tax=Thermococcus aciditolerans TaxID=2598455 RepID=A0A5C0SMZ1_9EURY|nr:COG1361 S-layer family protein [Thermococcus aciditolerans]QEK15177.1 hypothetical protein FPV09_08810 [Thermococcus aciditolerans]